MDKGEENSHITFNEISIDLNSTMYSSHVKHVIMFVSGSITLLDCW